LEMGTGGSERDPAGLEKGTAGSGTACGPHPRVRGWRATEGQPRGRGQLQLKVRPALGVPRALLACTFGCPPSPSSRPPRNPLRGLEAEPQPDPTLPNLPPVTGLWPVPPPQGWGRGWGLEAAQPTPGRQSPPPPAQAVAPGQPALLPRPGLGARGRWGEVWQQDVRSTRIDPPAYFIGPTNFASQRLSDPSGTRRAARGRAPAHAAVVIHFLPARKQRDNK